ncbi:MAG TPA: hypothetical protein VM324_03175 [Egibacteraceae bacterium]|jgi:hypothetical protein|nr:hypothetical protein [Egibacteraceae bacterium]
MTGERRWSDPIRMVPYTLELDQPHKRALTVAGELLWDGFLDSIEDADPGRADFIQMLPPAFVDRAADDWRRWLATLATSLWKLGQPHPPRPASMAEQLAVGILADYAERDLTELADDGLVDLLLPEHGLHVRDWLDAYLDDFDHELLYDRSADGIDDLSTGDQYGFGRMDYEGMFAVFNELDDRWRGLAHPMAPLARDEAERILEDHLQASVVALAARTAEAAVAGKSTVPVDDAAVDAELLAHRLSWWLGLDVRPAADDSSLTIATEPDPHHRERLRWWLERGSD